MSAWLTIAITGALLAIVLLYVMVHFLPSAYSAPSNESLVSLADGVYLFLNPV